jgi:hypothetical protein
MRGQRSQLLTGIPFRQERREGSPCQDRESAEHGGSWEAHQPSEGPPADRHHGQPSPQQPAEHLQVLGREVRAENSRRAASIRIIRSACWDFDGYRMPVSIVVHIRHGRARAPEQALTKS